MDYNSPFRSNIFQNSVGSSVRKVYRQRIIDLYHNAFPSLLEKVEKPELIIPSTEDQTTEDTKEKDRKQDEDDKDQNNDEIKDDNAKMVDKKDDDQVIVG